MDSHLRETRIDGELAYDGHFLKVTRDRIRLPDGSESKREFIRHPGAVVILPLLADGRV
ncbi:MAG: ADP-ribose pyrophosphatase, partial [Telluria sp.]